MLEKQDEIHSIIKLKVRQKGRRSTANYSIPKTSNMESRKTIEKFRKNNCEIQKKIITGLQKEIERNKGKTRK